MHKDNLKIFNYSYTVLGVGGVGGLYGGKLAAAGAKVQFIARSDYDGLKKNGLKVDSCDGDFTVDQVDVYRSDESVPKTDVAIVALKTTHNHILPKLLPNLLNENGIVVLLQNGYGEEEMCQSIESVQTVIGGLCFVCSTKIAPGHIHHEDYGAIKMGVHGQSTDTKKGEVLQRVQQDFRCAAIDVSIVEDLVEARWRKLVWNIPFNGLSVVLQADTKAIIENEYSRSIVKTLMEETVKGARAWGKGFPSSFVNTMIEYTETMTPYLPSMRLDYDNGRTMEVQSMYEAPLAAAQEKGVVLPTIKTLMNQLYFLQAFKNIRN